MYDYGSPELNGKHYGGQAVPPSYPTEKIQDFPIALITGKTDMLSAPGDYNNLKEMLESQNSLVDFHETEVGHLSLLSPSKEYMGHLEYMVGTLLQEKVMDTYSA